MFLRRRKQPEAAAAVKPCGSAARIPPLPRHLGEVWHVLQAIAAEEDPRFRDRSLVEHFNASAEGARDVVRWLNIYQRRLDPRHEFELPGHWRRHRGLVLVARNWPEGTLWEAFDPATWFRAPIPPCRTEAELMALVDAHCNERG